MVSIRIVFVCSVIAILYLSISLKAQAEACRGQAMHEEAILDQDEEIGLCSHSGYDRGQVSSDGSVQLLMNDCS